MLETGCPTDLSARRNFVRPLGPPQPGQPSPRDPTGPPWSLDRIRVFRRPWSRDARQRLSRASPTASRQVMHLRTGVMRGIAILALGPAKGGYQHGHTRRCCGFRAAGVLIASSRSAIWRSLGDFQVMRSRAIDDGAEHVGRVRWHLRDRQGNRADPANDLSHQGCRTVCAP